MLSEEQTNTLRRNHFLPEEIEAISGADTGVDLSKEPWAEMILRRKDLYRRMKARGQSDASIEMRIRLLYEELSQSRRFNFTRPVQR